MKRAPSGIAPIIAIDRKAPTALYRQIYEAYRGAIVAGRLRPGQGIPSTRTLAAELGVSRFPVLNAYAQLLAEGYFESRVGAGTVVSRALREQRVTFHAGNPQPDRARSGPRIASRRSSVLPTYAGSPWLRELGPFCVGQVALDQFPLRIWSNLVARRSRKDDTKSLHYGDPMGSYGLREAIAGYLRTARSVQCEASQVMIVSGSQQALQISTHALFDPGSRVWVEEPGYGLARDVLAMAGCSLVAVAVDHEGMDVAAAIQQSPKAQAALVTPSHQFPLGVTMSASRRLQLLDWARGSGSWIIEDDYDSEYRYESSPIASLQGLDRDARVVYIGTFSKVLFPSLRLGYLIIPPDLVDRFLIIRRAMDLGPVGLYQAVLEDFIREGHFARHLRRMKALYHERRRALIASLNEELESKVEVLGGDAGMHLVVALAEGTRDHQIAERAARQNLWLWPLSSSYLSERSRPGLILGFGGTPAVELPRAVRKLRDLLAKD
jgi:GntR family transcriptional regulator/MocR family aminotransferase